MYGNERLSVGRAKMQKKIYIMYNTQLKISKNVDFIMGDVEMIKLTAQLYVLCKFNLITFSLANAKFHFLH